MKRTVKAWAMTCGGCEIPNHVMTVVMLDEPKINPYAGGKIIPCTITYDDGRKKR